MKIVLFCCRRGLLALVPLIILYLCLRSGWWVVDDIRRAFKSLSSSTTSSICCFFPEQLCTAAGSLRKTSTICNNCPNIDILSIVIGKICARGVRCIWTFYSPIRTSQGPGGPSKVLRIYQNLQQRLILNEHHGKF